MSGHEFAQLTAHDSSAIQAGDRYANNYISSSGTVVLLNNDTQSFEQVQQLAQQLQDLRSFLLPASEARVPLPSSDRPKLADIPEIQEEWQPPLKPKIPPRSDAVSLHALPEVKQSILLQQEPEGIPGPYFIVPYGINGRFIQRPNELATLSRIFTREDTKKNPRAELRLQPRAALYGLGGVGKTQLAIHFAHEYRRLHRDHSVFWIHASTEEWLHQSFQSIADECAIKVDSRSQSDLFSAVGAWLKKSPRPWLMILDNADDADFLFCKRKRLADVLAECPQGAILGTTRNKRVAEKITRYGSSIAVGQMSPRQCVDLMKSFLRRGYGPTSYGAQNLTEPDLENLSHALGCLPLALAQAAAYIRENSISPSYYLEIFNSSTQNAQALLDSEFEADGRQHFDTDVPNAVGTTMMLSLDYLRKRKPRVGEALVLLSFLHPTNIQPALLLKPEEEPSQPSFIEALGDLQAFSLLQKSTDGSTYTMHRLVHHATCRWRTTRLSRDELQSAIDAAVKQLLRCFEKKYGRTDRAVADLQLPHALQYLQEESLLDISSESFGKIQLMRRVAEHFLYQGRISDSADLRCDILELAQTHFTTDTIEVLRSKCELAEVFEQLHRFENAQTLCEEIIGALESTESRRQTYVNTLRTLSRISVKRGRFESALRHALAAKKAATEFLGEEHEDALVLDFNVAEAMRHTASRLVDRDHYLNAAKTLLQSTLRRLAALKGENHSLTVLGKQHLVNVLDDLQEFDMSVTLSKDIVASKRASLGEIHLETFQAKLGLALCFMKRAQMLEAENCILEALEHSSPVIDTHHLGRPKALQMLATIHEKRAEYWKIQSQSLYPGPESLSRSLETETSAEYEQASLDEFQIALELKTEVSKYLKASPGIEHPHTLQHMIDTSRTCMQLFLTNKDDFKENMGIAEQIQREVLVVQADLLGTKHPDTLITKGLLMVTLIQKGGLDEADQLAIEIYKHRVLTLGRVHRDTLDMQQILAEIMYKQESKRITATKLIYKCYQSTLKAFGKNNADTRNRCKMWTKWRSEAPAHESVSTASASQSTWRMLEIDENEMMRPVMSRPVAYNTLKHSAPIVAPLFVPMSFGTGNAARRSNIYTARHPGAIDIPNARRTWLG